MISIIQNLTQANSCIVGRETSFGTDKPSIGISKLRSKHLGILLIFTPIPLTPKKCGLSIGYKGWILEWHTLTYTIL